MNRLSGFNRALIGLGVAAAIGCMLTGPGSAGVQDSVFFVSPDGGNVAFDVRDVSRREVLHRLLNSKAVELEWVDRAYADERISGAFNGSTDAVLQRLLAQTDFVAVYDRDGGKARIARLIIVGKAASPSKSVGLQGTSLATAGNKCPRRLVQLLLRRRHWWLHKVQLCSLLQVQSRSRRRRRQTWPFRLSSRRQQERRRRHWFHLRQQTLRIRYLCRRVR